jgi:flavin-binding protein dodecin
VHEGRSNAASRLVAVVQGPVIGATTERLLDGGEGFWGGSAPERRRQRGVLPQFGFLSMLNGGRRPRSGPVPKGSVVFLLLRRALEAKQSGMDKSMHDSVYKVIELVGSSPDSWEKAAANAVEMAAKSLRELRIAEVVLLDMHLENGKIVAYRAKLKVSFKFDGD